MVANVITIFNQKGGCGKTTIAIQLAGTLGRRGQKALLIDMDDQNTATRWVSQASDDLPFPAALMNLAAMGGRMHREVRNQIDIYDFIIIDCPPAIASPAPSSAMLISNLALIPVVPAPADMWAAVAAKKLAATAQATNESLHVRVVPNMVQRNTNLARDTIDILAEDPEIPLTRIHLGSRSAFRECQLLGATVHQVPKATVAVEEVESLTDEVLGILGIDAKKGDHQ
jgi:chromosome partitioning protein